MGTTEPSVAATLPPGHWGLDHAHSELGFQARGMFGLASVKGTFREYDGELDVDASGASGRLRIVATSLDTGNAKRDTHLRSADFFDVERHPTVTFSLDRISTGSDGRPTLGGRLQIRESALEVTSPLEIVEAGPDRVTLRTDLAVDRAAAGVGWSKLGMIRGPARLHASIALTRQG